MQAGELWQILTLKLNTPTTAQTGEPTESWSTVSTVRAEVRALTGDERMRAWQAHSEVTHVITLRYRSGVTPKHRFEDAIKNRNYAILWLDENQRRDGLLVCYCKVSE